MKLRIFSILLICATCFSSCKKEEQWDESLNGTWKEVTSYNAKSLQSNCEIVFDKEDMLICGTSITDNLGGRSNVHALNGQIWINYKLAFRMHTEYRYDYYFDNNFLYITEENTTKNIGTLTTTSSFKKYERK